LATVTLEVPLAVWVPVVREAVATTSTVPVVLGNVIVEVDEVEASVDPDGETLHAYVYDPVVPAVSVTVAVNGIDPPTKTVGVLGLTLTVNVPSVITTFAEPFADVPSERATITEPVIVPDALESNVTAGFCTVFETDAVTPWGNVHAYVYV